jgi:hypothetical protein
LEKKQMASLSAKYMAALGQLEQFAGTTSPDKALLTHLLTGQPEVSHSPTQKRIRELREYLRGRHDLD